MSSGNHSKKANPRSKNGSQRRKLKARLRALGLPCAICGRPIDYDAPSDSAHPYSFVVDEIRPVARYKEFGYASPTAAALDWNNIQACHYICNQLKGSRTMAELEARGAGAARTVSLPDGDW